MVPSDGSLGLVTVYAGSNPIIDIVAVHGLAATPERAWVRDPDGNDQGKRVNWLADPDMLPAQLPDSRIMTFNYESKWLVDAPKQRLDLCAIQLLTALNNERRSDSLLMNRPLLFIGHSFGGIVVEQALVNANSQEDFQHIATSTVGVVFLGTPHRGASTAKYGEYVTYLGKTLNFGSEDKILGILQDDSEVLMDLVYKFSLWVNRKSIGIVCFFEQHETDCAKGATLAGVTLSWKKLVVGEKSACIDGHQKIPLPTDHFKINKFRGPEDPSYKAIYPILVQISQSATEKVKERLHPRRLVHDDSYVPKDNLSCLQSLTHNLSNPLDDLTAIKRVKGDRVEGTCEWILVQKEYTSWLVENGFQFLRLVGGPGIGKTMMSLFLVNELQEMARHSSSMTLLYYFIDNKVETRNTANGVLRVLLFQLLRQRPGLFKHIQSDYDHMEDGLRNNFDALWRILLSMLRDDESGEVYIVVDALDECDKESRHLLLRELSSLAQAGDSAEFKWLITCRPEPEIEDTFAGIEKSIRTDSGKVNADLSKYIDVKVAELSTKKKYPPKLRQEITTALEEKAGGTFLWVSLVLEDLSKTQIMSKVRRKLEDLPSTINEVYDRILGNIDLEYSEDAQYILQWVSTARRPLKSTELAMARALESGDWDEKVPSKDDLEEFMDGFRCCEPLLYYDESSETINLVHQSAKDYLLSEYLQRHQSLSIYGVVFNQANLNIAQTCWRFMTMDEFQHGQLLIHRKRGNLVRVLDRDTLPDACDLFRYAVLEWLEHIVSAHSLLTAENTWDQNALSQAWTLRDFWLLRASEEGHERIVKLLLDKGADIDSTDSFGATSLFLAIETDHNAAVQLLINEGANINDTNGDGYTPLSSAAADGNEALVRLLLDNGAHINWSGWDYGTPLSCAANYGHESMVKLLLAEGADVNSCDRLGGPISRAASSGYDDIVKLLLDNGADIEIKGYDSIETPLSLASNGGHEGVMRLLLSKGADIESKGFYGKTPLIWATERGKKPIVELLLDQGANIEAKSFDYGWTSLSIAVKAGYTAVVKLLLDRGADIESKDRYGQTPLAIAAERGFANIAELLLSRGADTESNGLYSQRTPLSWAVMRGHIKVVKLLLKNGADVGSKDHSGETPLSLAEQEQGAILELFKKE